MFCVALVLTLGSSRESMALSEDPSLFLCDHTYDGDVCDTRGMALYVSAGNPPPRPKVFYPVSHTQWTFKESFISGTLGVTSEDQANVSGKFSGVFIPILTGLYKFQLRSYHTIRNRVCRWNAGSFPTAIEIDLAVASGGSSGGQACETIFNDLYCKNWNLYANEFNCYREYNLIAYEKYPLFAGLRYNLGVPYNNNLWLKLTYTDPNGKSYRVTSTDGYVGLKGYSVTPTASASPDRSPSPSPTVGITISTDVTVSGATSGNNTAGDVGTGVASDSDDSMSRSGTAKVNAAVVGGVCSVIVVIIIVADVAVFFFLRKKMVDGKMRGNGRSSSGEGLRGGGVGRRSVSGVDRRVGSNGTSHRTSTSGTSHRTSTSRTSHRASTSGTSHRASTSGTSHHSSTSGTNRRVSGNGTSYRVSGNGTNHRVSGKGTGRRVSDSRASRRKGGIEVDHHMSGGRADPGVSGSIGHQGGSAHTRKEVNRIVRS